MNNATKYWQQVRARKDQIRDAIAEMLWQPKDSTVYVVSVECPAKGITAGRVTHVTLDQACILIEAGTHTLATADQVEAFNRRPKNVFIDVEIPAKPAYKIQKEN